MTCSFSLIPQNNLGILQKEIEFQFKAFKNEKLLICLILIIKTNFIALVNMKIYNEHQKTLIMIQFFKQFKNIVSRTLLRAA